MCGRYTDTEELSQVGNRLKMTPMDLPFHPRYNICPSQKARVVLCDGEEGNAMKLVRWGLIPSWAKDAQIGYKMINARAETVAEKPSYRRPFQKQRCLVLADGFYEWKKVGSGKVPHWFTLKGKEGFAFA